MTDRKERRSGRGKRGMRGASMIGMRGKRDVSVTGLRGKIDARDKRGRRKGRSKSERTIVRGSELIEDFFFDIEGSMRE